MRKFDFEKFRREREEKEELKKSKVEASVQRATECQMSRARMQEAKAEAKRLKAEAELISTKQRLLNTNQSLRELLELLLRRRTLLRNKAGYDMLQLRLKANDSALNRQIDELCGLLGVEDPSERMDNDHDEEAVL